MENAATARISGIESSRQTQFEGVTVSTGFVWHLQDTVLRLERNQQDFIKQLDHANSLAAEYHETAVMYQKKYDAALHEMNDLKNQHAREIAELFERLNRAEEETRDERALKEEYTQQIEGLKQQVADLVNEKNEREEEEEEEQMSPVSVASPSPREQPQQQQRPQPIQSFNTCYSESEEDEGAYYHDGDTESDGEYYYNEECQCLECREMYAANNANANANNDLCQCDECRSSQSSQTYEYDADGKLVPVCYQSDNGDN
jgi:chromosome segregation ATPase